MKKSGKIRGFQRTTVFNGKRKVGIDTNILIKLYSQPFLFSYEESRIFNFKDIIFTHAICFRELIKYLMEKDLTEIKAKEEAKRFLKDHNINLIYPRECFVSEKEVEEFEKESNIELKKFRKDYLKCHKPDSIILLAFKKCRINKIISTDESFRRCAKFMNIDASSIPSLDKAISREFKKIFNYKKKRKY